MPTYAYACTSCHHRFDIYQAFSDAALTECPECGGTLRKQFGNVGVVFKGAGFYRNDARGTSATSESSGSSDSSSSSSSSGSSESSTSSAPKESGSKDSSSTTKAASTASTSSSKAS
ncbi:FmdB family zinc ribbon protein [Pseudactinotalea suaedae]|uniref:FmdB family zinc ribbon protein n=1 Tax=Pseudactinotalea suaedae TaxID=1524924 RepID=UPI0012E1212D|nr:FmdB family zinc ribbon protein [Pseudactinotalea suaedae]